MSNTQNKGKISQIIGVVVDVHFNDKLPKIHNALETEINGQKLVLEVQQHLGLNEVRTIAMSTTDGLTRGAEVIDTEGPISTPVGKKTLGRMFDVVGKPIDGKEELKTEKKYPIHRLAPKFVDQSTKAEILETGDRKSVV